MKTIILIFLLMIALTAAIPAQAQPMGSGGGRGGFSRPGSSPGGPAMRRGRGGSFNRGFYGRGFSNRHNSFSAWRRGPVWGAAYSSGGYTPCWGYAYPVVAVAPPPPPVVVVPPPVIVAPPPVVVAPPPAPKPAPRVAAAPKPPEQPAPSKKLKQRVIRESQDRESPNN